jgi:HAD superfamily hydrolase (TIGR01662 family)
MSNEVRMVIGSPASGKSGLSHQYSVRGYVHLNRDTEGGKVIDLLPKMEAALAQGKDVVLDNLFPTAESRKPFIDVASKVDVPVRCTWVATSLEDAQVNALHRMWDKEGRVFLTQEDMKGIKSPNIFPVAVLFKYRKEFEKPTKDEGFDNILKYKFERDPPHWEIKGDGSAFIFDYDDTLRYSTGEKNWPTDPSEVALMEGRKEKLAELKKLGVPLLGVSNQATIAKGLPEETAVACFERTNELLGIDIEYVYCPHKVPPVNCYCRKPQSGWGVHLVRKHGLDPAMCVFVGDQTSDKTFAKRMGFQFEQAEDFFK